MGITTNNYRRYRIVKGHTGKQLLIPINRNANILAYRRKQNPGTTGLFVTNRIPSSYADIQPSYDLTSDHSPIIATISTAVVIRKPTPRLHNAKKKLGILSPNNTRKSKVINKTQRLQTYRVRDKQPNESTTKCY